MRHYYWKLIIYTFLYWLPALGNLNVLQAQRMIHLENGCAFASEPERGNIFINDQSISMQDILVDISERVNLPDNAFEIKSSSVKTAIATIVEGRRMILYNEDFISTASRNTQSKWVVYSIVAHEIGHHILDHNFETTDVTQRKAMELAADEFSGRVLRSLCASQEEAVAVLKTLPADPSPFYPPNIARVAFAADGWKKKDEALERDKIDPCEGANTALNYGSSYGKFNLAKNVMAKIKEDQMTITFDVDPIHGKSGYQSYLVTPRYSRLVPASLEWVTDPSQAGNKRQLIWYFADDGYTRREVDKVDGLGILTCLAKKEPKPIKWAGFSQGAGVVALGTGAWLVSSNIRKDAIQPYESTYASIRDPNHPVYQGANPSRTELYNQLNRKYRRSQTYRNAGFVLMGAGIAWLVDHIIKDKRGRKGTLYGKDGTLKINLDDLFDRRR